MTHAGHRWWVWAAAAAMGVGLVTWGLRRRVPAPAADATHAKPLRGKPRSAASLPSTDADVYLTNLDGEISELTRLMGVNGKTSATLLMASGAVHTRGRYRGDLDEIQRGIALTTECVELAPAEPNCLLARAEQEQSLHRFPAARADAERARGLGGDPTRIADLVAELDWNEGRYDGPMAHFREARQQRPSTGTWLREAQLEHDLGGDEAAERAFERAEDRVADTAPFPIAHLNLQRGMHEADRGRLEEACVFFREAIARMPTYVAALEHLAETLRALGRDAEAMTLYEQVTRLSTDPEFAFALATLYDAHDRKAEAAALHEKARAGYEALLQKYPEAMYWHAAEYFAAKGDAKRAHELLQKNLVLRPNSGSYVALAKVLLTLGRIPEAAEAIDKALAMPLKSAALFWTAARVKRAQADVPAATTFEAQARALNPRIASVE